MKLREKVARAIAEARTGLDSDTSVLPFQPASTNDGCVILPDDAAMPLWTRYLGAADAALAAIREEFEAAGTINADREVDA